MYLSIPQAAARGVETNDLNIWKMMWKHFFPILVTTHEEGRVPGSGPRAAHGAACARFGFRTPFDAHLTAAGLLRVLPWDLQLLDR